MIILLSIFIMLTFVVPGKKEFKFYVFNLVYLIVLFAFIISILRLLDLFDIFPNYDFFQIIKATDSSSDDYIAIDINFALLPIFFGIFGVFYFLQKTNSIFQIIYFNFLLAIFSLDIILSGSRRGLIVLIVFVFILAITKFVLLFKKNQFLKELSSNSSFSLLSLISLPILLSLFFFNTSFYFKTKALEAIGTKDVLKTKSKITFNIYRYVSAINKEVFFSELYERIWTVDFDPKDPDSGWGIRIHKTIFPLTGKNVEIVPNGVKGYLLDRTSNPAYNSGDSICESFTQVVILNVSKGDHYKASVYCFVSDSFDVDMAFFTVGGACIQKNIAYGKVSALYNLKSKGVWQKLELEFDCNKGKVPIYLDVRKKGVKDFSELKGYVIFAYPTYIKNNEKENRLSINVPQKQNENIDFKIINLTINRINQKKAELIINLDEINDVNSYYFLSNNSTTRQFPIPSWTSFSNAQEYLSSSILSFPFSILATRDSTQNDVDPIRNLASKLISEDSTYYSYKSTISVDTISSPFIGDRLLRWEFALNIYFKEFNSRQKIFGGGFNFLNWYGSYFLKDKTASDYPHNPFLSILLYSGIFGLLIYCFFLYKVFYYYLKYIKEYPLIFIFFLITFFFTFFSGGSPFDPPIFGFLSILPFFIHHIHKQEENDFSDTSPMKDIESS